MLTQPRDLEHTRARLTQWFRERLGADAIEISDLTKPSAGLSNETFLLSLAWKRRGESGREAFVVRLPPQGFQVFPEYDLARQYRVMERLHDTDVPVPNVRWLEADESFLGSPFYVMDRIDGEVPSEVPPYHTFGFCLEASPARRAQIWWSGIEALVRVHRVDWRRAGLDFLSVPPGGTGPLDAQLAYYRRYLDWVRGSTPQPILQRALEWLEENRFEPRRVTLCWGDARLPNLMFRDDRVVAVLDWEMAFLGDPEADLGWWIFLDAANSEGYGFPRLEGFPGKEETIRRYEHLTGWKVEHADYYEVFAGLRFGIIMARIAARMKDVGVPTPTPDFEVNNACTQRLAALLGLPPPGEARGETRVQQTTVRIQLRLTGPDGQDWYLVSEQGCASRHEGRTNRPDATLSASAADWNAIQRGELDRTQAFLGGRLKIEGDLSLVMQLEDAITKLSTPDG